MADSDEKRQEVAVATRSSNDEDGGTMDEVQDVPKGVTRKAASKLRVFLWGHPPETKEERRLLVKIDLLPSFVMSFLMLMYWSNYLNRTNLTSA
ncbi:unnamed protein product [Tilletia laevis]|uniref:Uncharacterized protein n=3 Tax=Tilletia TaxID=13289 RepID=A0A8X7ML23_9BASI|nr:hypothetical protein A4X06_0g8224 [Tilletia controversa]CAD6958403.1 unnamed protein product [Tilletia laevis]